MKSVYLCLALLIVGCYCQNGKKCPAKEDIKPCICMIGNDGKPWLTCGGLSSSEELRRAVQPMLEYKISTLYLEDSVLDILPADVFKGLAIDSLNIMFCNITSLSEAVNRPPFLGLENSLESLEIRKVFTNTDLPLVGLSLSHLKKLTLLQLEGNDIPTIGNNWFESGPYGLKQLHILSSNTEKVGSHAFAALKNLKQLSLTGGYVDDLSRAIFPKTAVALEMIDFSNNSLSLLPIDIFTSMPSLREVYLDYNALTGIDERVWAPVWSQLTHVYVSGNPIKCDGNLRWIYKYRLPELLHGQCYLPIKLMGKSLSKLTLKDFDEKK